LAPSGAGNVPPGVFIAIAEENEVIMTIGEWILHEACGEAASWPHGFTVAANLSPVQFRQGNLFALIRDVLVETGLSGNRLELEITEGVVIADSATALGILPRIKALAVQIAMDDFGTGYSSLAYLQSFPFDKIKIDRSFVANVDSNSNSVAIVRAVLRLSRGLNIPVIAEGVETEAQVAFLKREDCDELQGYPIGHPLPIEEYAARIERGRDVVGIRRMAVALSTR
jgi:diguanylate cyclase